MQAKQDLKAFIFRDNKAKKHSLSLHLTMQNKALENPHRMK
jgi:hypothetical protein